MKKLLILICLFSIHLTLNAQSVLNLDSCRALAIANNKDLLISQERITSAYNQKKAAFTNYLPHISGTGAYMRKSKGISLLSNNQQATLGNIGTAANGSIQEFAQSIATQYPDLVPLVSSLGANLEEPLNGLGSSLADALKGGRNTTVGMLSLTQPVYMGGKIRAYNKITKYAEELAKQQHNTELQELILNTDQAYWQVISLINKKKLAEGYRNLLQKLDDDIQKMVNEGVATVADGLSVRVKLNEAEVTLTKVENGLSLSKMLLCQLCGIPLNTPIALADESIEDILVANPNTHFDMEEVYANRPEIYSLELGTKIYQQKINVARSEHLPTVALTGSYLATNPSFTNGVQRELRGRWSIGVLVQAPIWSWREGTYKVRSAKAEANIARYQLEDIKEKIELQVNQEIYKVNEANKKLVMTSKNMEKAEENLRYANLGFKEGVIATSNVLEAQTAWLSAQAEKIDAQIDAKLTDIYLKRALGSLSVGY